MPAKGLVINYGEGGLQNGRGACEVLPLRKGGGGQSFSHAEEGAQKFWGSFYAVAWRFSHIEGAQKMSTL